MCTNLLPHKNYSIQELQIPLSLQLKVLTREIGNLDIEEVSLTLLKEYLAKQSERLKPSSLGQRIRFERSLFRFAFEEGHVARNPALKLREPKMEKRIPKFLIEEDVIHLKITCDSPRPVKRFLSLKVFLLAE